MTYLYTFRAFMMLLVVTNITYTITQAALWKDRYDNFVYNLSSRNQNWKPARSKVIASSLALSFLILFWTFVESNHLIP